MRNSKMRDKTKFLLCSDQHDIEECQVFLGQIVEESSKIYRKKFCYGCLSDISRERNA